MSPLAMKILPLLSELPTLGYMIVCNNSSLILEKPKVERKLEATPHLLHPFTSISHKHKVSVSPLVMRGVV